MALKIKASLLIGIFAATIAGLPFGVTTMPEGNLIDRPPSLATII